MIENRLVCSKALLNFNVQWKTYFCFIPQFSVKISIKLPIKICVRQIVKGLSFSTGT